MSLITCLGSPPHTRGKAAPDHPLDFVPGITPAYAGKRRDIYMLHRPPRDHPRIRGEKHYDDYGISLKQGSPPHTRGKD